MITCKSLEWLEGIFLKVRQLRVRTDTFADYNSVASPYQFRPGCPLLKRRKSDRLNKNALAFCYRAKGLPMFVHFARAESSLSLSLSPKITTCYLSCQALHTTPPHMELAPTFLALFLSVYPISLSVSFPLSLSLTHSLTHTHTQTFQFIRVNRLSEALHCISPV